MNWYLILFVGVLAALLLMSFNQLGKNAIRIHSALDSFKERAQNTRDLEELFKIKQELVNFARREVWHKHSTARVREILGFINGKISVLNNGKQ